jgi:hypothetical protein
MWYTVNQPCLFLRYIDGSVDELDESLPPLQQLAMISQATEVIKATVKKMRVCIFLGPLVLAESATPFAHDEFPFVPFVGYLDRYLRPYGIPRQVRDMQMEVNRRRSMALRLLNAHQMIAESDATDTGNMQHLYEEGQKPDGFMVVTPGALQKGKFQIVDKAQLAPAQMDMMARSEQEIQRVSGINSDIVGKQGGSEANKKIDERVTQGVTITAPLFDNLRRSMKKMGELVVAGIQSKWTGEKIFRVTDRMSGAERFVEINKKIQGQSGSYEIKNDITKGRYDIVVSQTPIADTIRERNMELLIEVAKRSTPEMLGPVIMAAMELSSIPNKDKLLAQLKPILGISPEVDEMNADELKAYQVQQAQAKAQVQQALEQNQIQLSQAQVQKLMADIAKVVADTERVKGNTALDPLRVEQMSTKIAADHAKAQNDSARVELDGFKAGAEVQNKTERLNMEQENRRKDDLHHVMDREEDSSHQDADRKTMTAIELKKLQAELAKSPPPETATARQNKNIGSTASKQTNM